MRLIEGMDRRLTDAWARESTRRLIISFALSIAFHAALFCVILGMPWLAALFDSAAALRLNGHRASMGNFASAAASRGSKGDDQAGIITLVRVKAEQPEPVTEPPVAPAIKAQRLSRSTIPPAKPIEQPPADKSPTATMIRADQVSRNSPADFKLIQPARRSETMPSLTREASAREASAREASSPAVPRRAAPRVIAAEAASPSISPESGPPSPTHDPVAPLPSKLADKTPARTPTEPIRLAQAAIPPHVESLTAQAAAVVAALATEGPERHSHPPSPPDPTAVPGVPVRSIRSTPRLGSRGATPDVAGMGGTDDPPIPRIVHAPATYPPEARRLRLEGETRVEVDLTDDGRVATARLETSSGHTILDEAALRDVRTWRFRIPKAERVPMTVIVYVGYHL